MSEEIPRCWAALVLKAHNAQVDVVHISRQCADAVRKI